MAELGAGTVALDTAIFIYFIEEDARFISQILPLFRDADDGRRELVTSALTLMEVLVVPYRAGNRVLAERYEALLTRSRGIRIVDLSVDQLRAAAQLRAATGVKTPDALQLVAAISAGCKTFLTNDRRLPPVPGLRILQLAAHLIWNDLSSQLVVRPTQTQQQWRSRRLSRRLITLIFAGRAA